LEKGVRGIEVDNQMITMKNNDINPLGVLFSILVKMANYGYKVLFSPASPAGGHEFNFLPTPVNLSYQY
jgi:hypothetical protein